MFAEKHKASIKEAQEVGKNALKRHREEAETMFEKNKNVFHPPELCGLFCGDDNTPPAATPIHHVPSHPTFG